jgi:hypothetical protein
MAALDSIRFDRLGFEPEELSADHDYVAWFKLNLGFYFDKGAVSAAHVGQYKITAALNDAGMVAGHIAVGGERDVTGSPAYGVILVQFEGLAPLQAVNNQSQPALRGRRKRHYQRLGKRNLLPALLTKVDTGLVFMRAFGTDDGR